MNIHLLQFITTPPQNYRFQVNLCAHLLLDPPTIRDGRVILLCVPEGPLFVFLETIAVQSYTLRMDINHWCKGEMIYLDSISLNPKILFLYHTILHDKTHMCACVSVSLAVCVRNGCLNHA